MSKRNRRNAAVLAQAIAVLDGVRWTWLARWTLKRVARKIIAKGVE